MPRPSGPDGWGKIDAGHPAGGRVNVGSVVGAARHVLHWPRGWWMWLHLLLRSWLLWWWRQCQCVLCKNLPLLFTFLAECMMRLYM